MLFPLFEQSGPALLSRITYLNNGKVAKAGSTNMEQQTSSDDSDGEMDWGEILGTLSESSQLLRCS